MEFAKYYNASKVVEDLLKDNKIMDDWNSFKGVYVCSDTNDFWVCRITEGYNEDYEQEEGSWLIERNKINKYHLVDFINEKFNKSIKINDRFELHDYFRRINSKQVVKYVILYDDEQGLENWDNEQTYSLEDCISMIDDGHGIINIK